MVASEFGQDVAVASPEVPGYIAEEEADAWRDVEKDRLWASELGNKLPEDDFPSVAPFLKGLTGGGLIHASEKEAAAVRSGHLVGRDVGDPELALMTELALLDDAVGSYLADFCGQADLVDPRLALPDPVSADGAECWVPSRTRVPWCRPSGGLGDVLDGSQPSSSSEAFRAAKPMSHCSADQMKASFKLDFREVTAETLIPSSLPGLGSLDGLPEEEGGHTLEMELTEWSDASVFGEAIPVHSEQAAGGQSSTSVDAPAWSALTPRETTFAKIQAPLPDYELPAVCAESASSGNGTGSGGGPTPRRVQSSTSGAVAPSGAGTGPPPRSMMSPRREAEGSAMKSPPRRKILVDEAARLAEEQAMEAEEEWHSTMPTAEDCPDQVISFEPVYDELELDFMNNSGQDAVYRKTKPVPCRPAPRKVMAGACDGDGSECNVGSIVPGAANAAVAVGTCLNESVLCRPEPSQRSTPSPLSR